MRTSLTFILRLLADPDEPEALRGMLRSVASGEERPFADGPALLVLLRRMVSVPPQVPTRGSETKDEEER